MTACICMIQDGCVPADTRAALEQRLTGFVRDEFGTALAATWVTVAKGDGFTEGKPSTASVVSITAPEPLDQIRRVELLHTLNDLWMEETRCGLDEVVAVLSDPR